MLSKEREEQLWLRATTIVDRLHNTYGMYEGVTKMMYSSIYVISNELGLIKVGRSINPKARAKQLECVSGLSCKLLFSIEGGSIEKEVHNRLKTNRKKGEWYECDPSIAIETIKQVKKEIVSGYYDKLEEKELELMFRLKRGDPAIVNDIKNYETDTLKDLIYFVGNPTKVARELGLNSSTVHRWLERGEVSKHGARLISKHPILKQFKVRWGDE